MDLDSSLVIQNEIANQIFQEDENGQLVCKSFYSDDQRSEYDGSNCSAIFSDNFIKDEQQDITDFADDHFQIMDRSIDQSNEKQDSPE